MDQDSLEDMCKQYMQKPETLMVEESRQYAQCCAEDYVDPEYAFCGNEINIAGQHVEVVECHEVQDFFSWDALTGLNMDLVFFGVNIAFYCALVVALELGYVDRARNRFDEWKRRRRARKGLFRNEDGVLSEPLDEVSPCG